MSETATATETTPQPAALTPTLCEEAMFSAGRFYGRWERHAEESGREARGAIKKRDDDATYWWAKNAGTCGRHALRERETFLTWLALVRDEARRLATNDEDDR